MKLLNEALDPLHRLILAYAKPTDRLRYALVFAFDLKLAEVIRSTSEPLIGQMRLTWWRDILTKDANDRPAGEPLIEAMNILEGQGVSLDQLSAMLDGWELLLEEFPWDDRQFSNYSTARGAGFFGFGLDRKLSTDHGELSKAWALWDFARHCSDPEMRQLAFDKCVVIVGDQKSTRFDRNGRPLSILCKLMARDVENESLSADLYRPKTAAKIVWHGVTGL